MKTAERCVKYVHNKDTKKTPVFAVNFNQILDISLVFPLLTLNM